MVERRLAASPMVRLRSAAVIALVALTGAACTPMDDVMVSIFGRSMRDQPSIGTYEDPRMPAAGSVPFASGNFPAAEGVVNLGQPEGSEIPMPVAPIDLLLSREDPDGFPNIHGLENPVAPSALSLERGGEVYDRACAPCHAINGDGAGPVTEAGVPSWSLLTDEASALSDGYIYSIIRVGRGAMPSYGHQIANFDRWHVVNYVRQLQGQ